MTQCMGQWQLELFYKRKQDLTDKILPFLRENSLYRLNITNKNKKDDLLESVATIYEGLPKARLCVHYALKWNSKGSSGATLTAFQDFCHQLARYEGTSVLLVSGTRPGKNDSVQVTDLARAELAIPAQRSFDTHLRIAQALQMLQEQKDPQTAGLPIAVAFNPYFPDQADFAKEKQRLERKLQTGLVDSIYLQNGNDLQRLKEGLTFIEQVQCKKGSLKILGSVFLPSKKLLAQMKFRPWNGVFLSKEFLSSVEKAEQITIQILSMYAQHGVIPLLESNIQKVDELRHALDLFKQGSEEHA